ARRQNVLLLICRMQSAQREKKGATARGPPLRTANWYYGGHACGELGVAPAEVDANRIPQTLKVSGEPADSARKPCLRIWKARLHSWKLKDRRGGAVCAFACPTPHFKIVPQLRGATL